MVMRKSLIVAALSFATVITQAQKESDSLPYKKPIPDSAWGLFPKLYQLPFNTPLPKEYNNPFNSMGKAGNNFEKFNPGAALLYETSRGSFYKMPLDNMAVLVP